MNYRLFAPGPTPVPDAVVRAMAAPIIHHRTPAFMALFARVQAGLAWIFQTEHEVITLAGSGTLGMEAAVVNFLSPGDCALYVDAGKFGERWGDILRAYGCQAVPIDVPWGQAVDLAQVRMALRDNPSARAVYVQACETSTGVVHPVADIAALCHAQADTLCIVDAITALGVMPLAQDAAGLDVVVSASQKALMLPPGLAFVGVSARAWQRQARSTLPRFYVDLARERDAARKQQSAWTSAVSLMVGLDVALGQMQAEGRQALFDRHARLAAACRAGVQAMGCTLYARAPAAGLTAMLPPEGIRADAVVERLQTGYNLTVVGGQDTAKGKIVRLAHMGHFDALDILTMLAALGCVFAEAGRPELGPRGQAAAQAILAAAPDAP
jgi:aspartate aminotransferase-like enzyme